MSRSIEDRLAAALEARAELVTPEDLGPVELPERPRHRGRNAALLLAAAATVAVVATPFVLAGDGDSPEPEPTAPTTTVPSESPSPSATERTGGVVADRQEADVDGDGRPDEVRLVLARGQESTDGGYVAVTLATGGSGTADLPPGYLPPELLPAYSVNDDGSEQVMLSLSGGDAASLLVYAWADGTLVRAESPAKVPLALGLDGEGKVSDYVLGEQGLTSWLRTEPAGPPTYRVEQWSWALDGGRLVPTSTGTACVDVTAQDPPHPCAG